MKTKFDLKNVLKKYGYRQVEVAEMIGVNKATISNFCRGATYPSVDVLLSMSDMLNIPIEDFFRKENDQDHEDGQISVRCPYCKKPITVRISAAMIVDNNEDV